MAPRVSRTTVTSSAPRTSNKKHRKRQLDAFAIAGKIVPEKTKIRSHRLGVAEDDEPKQKRRRQDSDEEGEEESEQDDARGRDHKRLKPGEDADVEYGSDSEGNEWVTGGLMNDDDDESIDSDEAFGESDEERFEGYTFRGSRSTKSKAVKRNRKQDTVDSANNVDLDENNSADEEEMDDFGDEGVDLATMLDQDESDDDAEGSSDEDDGESSRSEDSESDTSEDDNEEERHAKLQDFVEGLDEQSKENNITEVGEQKVTLDDLLEDADLDGKTLATLKPKRKSKAPQMVQALLPKRQQDAINREIATAKAKEQLDRWRDTVIQNRRAEFLTFPLRNSDETGPVAKDTFAPAQSQPSTELKADIQKIMEESGMLTRPDGTANIDDGESDLLKAEELATKDLPLEEVMRRRAELRRSRELMFREEIKAKRIAKIKSKSYRRVHRRERERNADKERMLMDPEAYANGELDEDEQDLADRRRAEARMNAKHKTSKWAKSLRATDRTVWDTEARDGAADMARRQEELKRRIAGKDIQNDDDEALTSGDEDEEGNDMASQVMRLRQTVDENTKGLAGMKFMRDAENRRKAQNDRAIDELESDLGFSRDDGDNDIEDEGLGRAIFGPRPTTKETPVVKQKRPELEEGDASDNEETEQAQDAEDPPLKRSESSKKTLRRRPLAAAVSLIEKPELQLNRPEEKSEWLTAPREKRSKLDRKLARQDDEALISTDIPARKTPSAQPGQETGVSERKAPSTNGWTEVQTGDVSDDEAPQAMLTQAERNAAFHARAFAGDDVALHFDTEKDALVASEDEKEINTSMPGWGSWAGSGLSKAAKKAAQRIRHNPLYKTKVDGVRPKDRKDARLENVIISEKKDRKGKQYLAPTLPHQYEKKEEYERSLRMPIGPEWVTKEVFQRNTRPRVVVKPGAIIEPISRPLI